MKLFDHNGTPHPVVAALLDSGMRIASSKLAKPPKEAGAQKLVETIAALGCITVVAVAAALGVLSSASSER